MCTFLKYPPRRVPNVAIYTMFNLVKSELKKLNKMKFCFVNYIP